MSKYDRNAIEAIITKGSISYEYKLAGLAANGEAGDSIWLHMEDIFPEARVFLPFDSLELINNSGQDVSLYMGSKADVITIPAYMIKPIARKPFMQLGIANLGSAATNDNEIILHVKRLPPNVQVVMSTNTLR